MKLGIDIGASHIGLGLLNDNNELIQKNIYPTSDHSKYLIKFLQNILQINM